MKFEKSLEIDNQKYVSFIYIEDDELVFKIELNDKKTYYNRFTKENLNNLDKYFKQFDDIEESFDDFKTLLDEKEFSIDKQNGNLSFTIKDVVKKGKNITIHLVEESKDNIEYSNLSNQMKKIIDENDLILGIDLGTSYSCSSIMIDNNIIIIPNSLGKRITPSFVAFLGENKICVGELAKFLPSKERNIIYKTKTILGRKLKDKEIKEIKEDLPFNLIEDENSYLKIEIEKEQYYPEQISAMIIKKIIKDSEFYLSKKIKKEIKIKKAVITVPAYFNQKQREATYIAAQIAELKIERMINEPTAASLACGLEFKENQKEFEFNFNQKKHHIIVIDFGGGTLDITLLEFNNEEKGGIYYDIKFTDGDTHLGGENFDLVLMEKCTNKDNLKDNKIKLPHNIRLKRACEKAKIELSSEKETYIILEDYLNGERLEKKITKKNFEEDCKHLFTKFETKIKNFLSIVEKDKKIGKDKISKVILIGGSTKIPKIREIIGKIFSKDKIIDKFDPNETVAKGAAIQGAIISKLKNVENINLFDVTNLSLGINVLGEKMSRIIKRSRPIPYSKDEIYKTVKDNQAKALIQIYEGENEDNKDNLFLGEFEISGLPKKKAGEAKIRINLHINEDSLLQVVAKDLSNEKNREEKTLNLKITKGKGLIDIIDNLKIEEGKKIYLDIEYLMEMAINKLQKKKNIIRESMHYYIDSDDSDEEFEGNKFFEVKKKIKKFEEYKKKYKYLIIEIEDEIYNSKNNDIIQIEKLISEVGNFIKEMLKVVNNYYEKYDKEEMPKFFISYIMYYFERINEYEIKKIELKYDNKKINDYIDEIIPFILNEINFYETDLIFEVIEIFKNSRYIYNKCISVLIQNFYRYINQKYYDIINKYKKMKDVSIKIKEADFSEIEVLYKKCLGFFKLLDDIPKEIFYTKNYVNDFETKIKAIKFLNENMENKILSKDKNNELNQIIKEYEKGLTYEVEILNDLYVLQNNDYTEKLEYSYKIERKILDAKFFLNKIKNVREEIESLEKRKYYRPIYSKIQYYLTIVEDKYEYEFNKDKKKNYEHEFNKGKKTRKEIDLEIERKLDLNPFFNQLKNLKDINRKYIENESNYNRNDTDIIIKKIQNDVYEEILCTINYFKVLNDKFLISYLKNHEDICYKEYKLKDEYSDESL